MRTRLMPVYVVLFLIGATALWYFGHHRPAQKILEAEPKRVYKSVRLQPADLSVKPTPSDATQEPRIDNTDIEAEDTSSGATPKKIDSNKDWNKEASADKFALQKDLPVDDPAAAEAFEKYIAAESEYQAAQERLKKAFPFKDTDPTVSATQEGKKALAESDYQAVMEGLNEVLVSFERMDTDQIRSAVEAFREAELRRNEALENLAVYSEDAADMLAQVKEAERQENERRTESERKLRELRTQLRNIQDQVEKLEASQ